MNAISTNDDNRPLTADEFRLARWMLEHGSADARDFLPQLEQAEVTSWKCPCGCASVNFRVKGYPPAPPGVHILGDFVFGGDDNLCGIFIYESAGILSGLEVCGYATDAPRLLPAPESLRSISGPHSA